jgi:archaellum component FlaC
MSNADPEEVVTAASDGVSVEKSFEPDDFPVPAIAFVVRSDREESVSIRLVDTVPSHVPPEDIGFHPKYGAEFWGVEGDTIVFEREFEPGEEYTTVYGLRGGDADDVEQFMSEPSIEDVDPPLEDADAGETVRDVIGDEETDEADEAEADAADPPGMTDPGVEAGAEDGEDVDTSLDLSDDIDDAEPAGTTDEAASTAPAATDGTLVSALADEIRTGNVDDDELEELRDALGVETASGTDEARIEHLQLRVSDLEAYTEALEEFLDENGDAQQLIADLQDDIEEATQRFDELEETAESAAETAESVESDFDERFEQLETRIDQELETVEARVGEALSELEDVDVKVEDTVEERLDAELEELWDAVDEAATEAEDVASELRAFREEVDEETAERVDDLETEVEELSEELEDVAEMRDRLASALGGLAGQGGDADDGGDDGDDE